MKTGFLCFFTILLVFEVENAPQFLPVAVQVGFPEEVYRPIPARAVVKKVQRSNFPKERNEKEHVDLIMLGENPIYNIKSVNDVPGKKFIATDKASRTKDARKISESEVFVVKKLPKIPTKEE